MLHNIALQEKAFIALLCCMLVKKKKRNERFDNEKILSLPPKKEQHFANLYPLKLHL